MREATRFCIAFAIMLVLTSLSVSAQSFTPPPNGTQLTLEGCRNDGQTPLYATSTPPLTCALNNGKSAYTTGNLSKGWNELDLVPFRLTAKAGATATYNVYIGGDYSLAGTDCSQVACGYDVITDPALNVLSSDGSCQLVAVGTPQVVSVTGGTEYTVVRELTIFSNDGATCVIDWDQRLAVGASTFSGSSLQAYLFDNGLSGGKRTVPLPVGSVLPQKLAKTMTATQDMNVTWSVNKSADKAEVKFGDTCNPSTPLTQPVTVTVTWEKNAPVPSGDINIETIITATNPSSRDLYISVSDQIYSGTNPIGLPIVTNDVLLPAGANNLKVAGDKATVPSGTTDLNDIATASYTDALLQVPVLGHTTATAKPDSIQTGQTTNTSATVYDDMQKVAEAGYMYSFDSSSPIQGSVTYGTHDQPGVPYDLGTPMNEKLTWNTGTVSDGGTDSIVHTITISGPGADMTATLKDQAKLIGSSGFEANSTEVKVVLDQAPRIALNISKKVPGGMPGILSPTTFTFHVKDAENTEVATPTVTFNAGDPETQTITVSDLAPGDYTITEDQVDGFTPTSTSQTVKNPLPADCSVPASFENTPVVPKLTLKKVVVNNWGGTAKESDFTLSASGPTQVSGSGPTVSSNVLPGTYTLSETNVTGYTASDWNCIGGTQSGNTLVIAWGDSPTCTITNSDKAAHLKLVKQVENNWGGTKQPSDFTLTGTGPATISGAGTVEQDVSAGTYALAESPNNLFGYSASTWSCVGGTLSGSSVTLALGESATCTITNSDKPATIIVKKITKPVVSPTYFSFTTSGAGYAPFSLQGGTQNSQTLKAGSYTVHENVPLGWTLTGIGGSTDPNTPYNCTVSGSGGSTGAGSLITQTATINLQNGDTVTCIFENTGQGATRTQGFWATHPQLASIAWFGGTGYGHTFPGVAAMAGDILICGRSIDTLGKVEGGFWSSIPSMSTGARRGSLDQNRMQLLQQLLAAELNASAFGSVPSGGFAAWENALCGTNTRNINTATQQAGAFNSTGDSSTFTPGTSADSRTARSIANIPFWDIIKP